MKTLIQIVMALSSLSFLPAYATTVTPDCQKQIVLITKSTVGAYVKAYLPADNRILEVIANNVTIDPKNVVVASTSLAQRVSFTVVVDLTIPVTNLEESYSTTVELSVMQTSKPGGTWSCLVQSLKINELDL